MVAEMRQLKVRRQRLVTAGALTGGVIAFIWAGMLDDLFKLALGAGAGALIGVLVWAQLARSRRRLQADELQDLPKADLQQRARRLDVASPLSKTKSELAEAIAAKDQHAGSTGDVLIEAVGAVHDKLGEAAVAVKGRLVSHHNGSSK